MAKILPRKSLYSAEYEHFLKVLRDSREKAGLSQEAAAAKLGRPQSYVSKSESGERRIDVIELIRFCRVYGVDASTFIKRLKA